PEAGILGYVTDPLLEVGGFDVVEPRRRLVEEQVPRTSRQGPGDLEPSLQAIGQLASGHIGELDEIEPTQALVGELVDGQIIGPGDRSHVVSSRQAAEQPRGCIQWVASAGSVQKRQSSSGVAGNSLTRVNPA